MSDPPSNIDQFYRNFCDKILASASRLIAASNNLTEDPVHVQILRDLPEYNYKTTQVAGQIFENFRKISAIGRSPLVFTPLQRSQFYSIVNKRDFPCDDADIFEPFIDSTDRMFAVFNNFIDDILSSPNNICEPPKSTLKKANVIAKPQTKFQFKRGNFEKSSEDFDRWCYDNFLFNNSTFYTNKNIDGNYNAAIVDTLLTSSYNKSPHNLYFKLENLHRHPYLMEILQFNYNYVAMVDFCSSDYHFGSTYSNSANEFKFPPPPAEFVDTPSMLEKLIEILLQCEIVAVDIEQHSTHSYLGIICLVQLTTLTNDYIIDAVKLHDYMFSLNKIFSEPKILKVFHGARNDILWLQRDFNIFVVNFFDTFIAANRFDICNGYSLANLLRVYCNVRHIDKQYQLADWRIRPLTGEMLRYAQSDTHYLLYLFKMLVKELFHINNSYAILEQVCEQCRRLSLQTFTLPTSDEEQIFEKFLKKRSIRSHCTVQRGNQMRFCKWLLKWRDDAARNLDESEISLLPDHVVVLIVETMPTDLFKLLVLCKPTPPEIFSNKLITDDILNNLKIHHSFEYTEYTNHIIEQMGESKKSNLIKSYNAIKIDEENDYLEMDEEETKKNNERIISEGERIKVRVKVKKIDEQFKAKLNTTILPKLYVKNPFDLSQYNKEEILSKFKKNKNEENLREKMSFHENLKTLSFVESTVESTPTNVTTKKGRGRPRKHPLPDSVNN